jgi:hypothetical protein
VYSDDKERVKTIKETLKYILEKHADKEKVKIALYQEILSDMYIINRNMIPLILEDTEKKDNEYFYFARAVIFNLFLDVYPFKTMAGLVKEGDEYHLDMFKVREFLKSDWFPTHELRKFWKQEQEYVYLAPGKAGLKRGLMLRKKDEKEEIIPDSPVASYKGKKTEN